MALDCQDDDADGEGSQAAEDDDFQEPAAPILEPGPANHPADFQIDAEAEGRVVRVAAEASCMHSFF